MRKIISLLVLASAATLLLALSGCAPRLAPEVIISRTAVATHIARLTPAIAPDDSLAAARRARYAADRLRRAGLQPVVRDSYFVQHRPASGGGVPDPARSHVIGYIAGRHAAVTDRLVLLTADLNTIGAAAALEAARLLVVEGPLSHVPEATVAVALWAPPRTGAAGDRDFLANPTWPPVSITRVLHITADTSHVAQMRREWEAVGIPFGVVASSGTSAAQGAGGADDGGTSEAYRLAHATHAAARRHASADAVKAAESNLDR